MSGFYVYYILWCYDMKQKMHKTANTYITLILINSHTSYALYALDIPILLIYNYVDIYILYIYQVVLYNYNIISFSWR